MQSSMSAQSVTVLAIGLAVSWTLISGQDPILDIRPGVTLILTRLQNDDGTWIEPPVSSPTANSAKLAPKAAPEPPNNAPTSCSKLFEFLVNSNGSFAQHYYARFFELGNDEGNLLRNIVLRYD
ncbi:hypothetical protein SCARD494_00188 [Seiridium cardinale]